MLRTNPAPSQVKPTKSSPTPRGVHRAKFLQCAKLEKVKLPPPTKSEKLGHWMWHESLG